MRRVLPLLIVLCALVVTPALVTAQNDTGAFVAIVGGDPITRYELEREYRLHLSGIQGELTKDQAQDLKQQVLDLLVMQLLLLQRCDQKQIEVTDADLKRYLDFELDRVRKEGHEILDHREYLKIRAQQTGRSEEEARQAIRDEIRIARLYRSEVFRDDFVSPQELREHYRANQAVFATEPTYKFRMLLVWRSTRDFHKIIEQAQADIKAGTDFAELVAKYSEGPQKDDGGVYERTDAELDSFHKPLRDMIRGLTKGQVSPAIHTPSAVHLIRLEEKTAGSLLSFSDAQEAIRQRILTQRRNEQRRKFENSVLDDAEARGDIERF